MLGKCDEIFSCCSRWKKKETRAPSLARLTAAVLCFFASDRKMLLLDQFVAALVEEDSVGGCLTLPFIELFGTVLLQNYRPDVLRG